MLKKIPKELITLMSDGQFHSGESIGAVLGISRAAVWKKLQLLEGFGIEVESVKGRGYRLSHPVKLLNKRQIVDGLSGRCKHLLVEVFDQIHSTNSYLMEHLDDSCHASQLVLAEYQSAGKGRRGRPWIGSFGSNLYLSLSRQFEQGLSALDGLSLVAGISLVNVLEQYDIQDVALKWPNDILINKRKLSGILLEVSGDPVGLSHVVIGIGLNVNMYDGKGEIDQAWTSIYKETGNYHDRNKLVVDIVNQLMNNLDTFSQNGFSPFREGWLQHDAYYNQEVILSSGENFTSGIARGVTDNGALLLETNKGLQSFNAGEVSLRLSS